MTPQHVNVILSIKKWVNFRHGPLRFKQFAKKKKPAHDIAEKVGFQFMLSSDPIEVSVLVRSY